MFSKCLNYLFGGIVFVSSVLMLSQVYSDDVHSGIATATESDLTHFDNLKAQLDSPDRDKVRLVLKQLGDAGGLQAFSLLEDIWKRGELFRYFKYQETFYDPVVRLMLARQLLAISKNMVVEYADYIKSQAYSKNWIVRANAADALAVVNDIESVDLLYKIALTPHSLVALRAVRALERVIRSGINSDKAFSYLDKLNADSRITDEDVKREIIDARRKFLERSRSNAAGHTEEFTPFDKMHRPYPYQNEISKLVNLAESGDPQAQHMLGERYLVGIGVEQNYDKAKKWLISSVEQNYAPAKASLAQMYLTGRGVELNRARAIGLLEEAAHQGYMAARELLKKNNLEMK
ncbi:MAG: hypothetical protein ABW168_06125 [Sedimenticola sp.]